MSDGNGGIVTLDWRSGKLVVTGSNMDVGAKIFFDFLKQYVDQYIASIVPLTNLEYLEWKSEQHEHASR
ncbi:MAG: hypothetical protein ACREBR_04640 [bacterium]